MTEAAIELDLRGLRCPLPALRTEKQLRAMRVGERLSVLTDDPLAAIDIPHFCRTEGHLVVAQAMEDVVRRFVIECGKDSSASE